MCNMLNQDDSGKLLTSNIILLGFFFIKYIKRTNPTVAFSPEPMCCFQLYLFIIEFILACKTVYRN